MIIAICIAIVIFFVLVLKHLPHPVLFFVTLMFPLLDSLTDIAYPLATPMSSTIILVILAACSPFSSGRARIRVRVRARGSLGLGIGVA